MRPWLLMFLLLSSIHIHEAHGIRLRKGTVSDEQQSITINQTMAPGTMRNSNIEDVEEAILCERKHCSGMIRKLTRTPNSSTTTIAKNNQNIQVNEARPGRDSEVSDIAGMDYSLTRRKPPIHN